MVLPPFLEVALELDSGSGASSFCTGVKWHQPSLASVHRDPDRPTHCLFCPHGAGS